MKSISRPALFLAAALMLGAGASGASDRLFSTVPAGDTTYVKLQRLEDLGLLPNGASEGSLTRYEVAQLIFRARTAYDRRYSGVRLAQAELPPPPDFGDDMALPDFGGDDLTLPPEIETVPVASEPTGPSEQAAPAAAMDSTGSPQVIQPTGPALQAPSPPAQPTGPAEQEVPVVETRPAGLEEQAAPAESARAALGSLEEAYQYELNALKDDTKRLDDRVQKDEEAQFKIWKRLRILENATAIYLHGLGRVFGESRASTGDLVGPQRARLQTDYLDLNPTGVVSKEIRWSALFRVKNFGVPLNTADAFVMRRATLEFNPAWISATMGNFEESYTPLTLWNRSFPDLRYTPEAMWRRDQYLRYESFLDKEGSLPFRGLRLATEVMWPRSDVLDTWTVSTFAHMITSGYDNGYYDHRYSSWAFGGRSTFRARKVFSLDAQGVMLDEPLDSDNPASTYNRYDPNTWAQRYNVGSLRPKVEFELNRDWKAGIQYEMAYSIYQDDKRDSDKNIKGSARLGGPFVRFRHSTLQINLLDTDPSYYSPLGQIRQEEVTSFPPITNLYRPSGLFTEYDRHTDNVFPYGLASPNRKGAGLELGVKALEKDALKVDASAYQLKENGGNFVMNLPMTDLVPVDGPGNSPAAVRDFTYINVGPKLNIAPLMDLPHDLVVGVNYRSEKTESWIGQLKSNQVVAGVEVGLLSWWDVSAFGSVAKSTGRESFLGGSSQARYGFPFDNRDLGAYSIVNTDVSSSEAVLATTLRVNRNSRFYLEMMTGTDKWSYPDFPGTDAKVSNGGGRFIYEIEF